MKTRICPKCNRPALELHHVRGHPGEYCAACKPDAAQQRDPFVEVVNGFVIGAVTSRFEFWTLDNAERIDKCDAENSDAALAWFKDNYPQHYAQGALMRCYED